MYSITYSIAYITRILLIKFWELIILSKKLVDFKDTKIITIS